MEKKIKQFFQKKKVEAKFKLAGPGHKLSDAASSSTSSAEVKNQVVVKRSGLTEESKVAAEAALARLSLKRENPLFNTSYAYIQVCATIVINDYCKQSIYSLPWMLHPPVYSTSIP